MHHQHDITIEGKHYIAGVMVSAHNGRAALVSLYAGEREVGGVLLVAASIPDGLLKWGTLNDEQFLQMAWLQFETRGLAASALSSEERPLVVALE